MMPKETIIPSRIMLTMFPSEWPIFRDMPDTYCRNFSDKRPYCKK